MQLGSGSMYDKDVVGKRIQECRIRNGLTQQELGARIKFSRSKVSNIETGRNYVSVPDALLLCKELNVGLDTIFYSKEMGTSDFLSLANNYFINKKIPKKERKETLKKLLKYLDFF